MGVGSLEQKIMIPYTKNRFFSSPCNRSDFFEKWI